MTALTSKTSENIHELLDYNVIDQAGNEIGTLHSFWADSSSGKLEFIGVKTGWLFGHNHVIPVDRVEFDDTARAIRVPYDAEFIKGAQSIDANAEITDAEEAEIYRYYNVRAGGRTATDTTVNPATTGAAGYAATANTVGTATTANTAATAGTATDKDNIEVPLTEEQVKVGKRTVDAGQVRLRKMPSGGGGAAGAGGAGGGGRRARGGGHQRLQGGNHRRAAFARGSGGGQGSARHRRGASAQDRRERDAERQRDRAQGRRRSGP